MKKVSCFIVIFLLLTAIPIHADKAAVAAAKPAIQIYVNDEQQHFSIPPIKLNNSVLLPIRSLFNALKIPFQYDSASGSITAEYDNISIKLVINEPTAYINGKSVKLSQPPSMLNNYTYVPVRFISEAFNAKVTWDEPSQAVHIRYGSQSALFSAVVENDFEAYRANLLAKSALAAQAAEHVIYNNNGVEWLELALQQGASAEQALESSIWWNQLEYVQFILENKLVSVDFPYISETKLTYIGASTYRSQLTRYMYRDESGKNSKLYKLSKEPSSSIAEVLHQYGFKPSTTDLLPALINYEESSVKALEQLLSFGADLNGTTVEVVTLFGNSISFDSITHPKDLTSHASLITTAFRILSWNPGPVNYEKFHMLFKAGARLSPLSDSALERLEYLYKDTQYTDLYQSIVQELHA